MVGLWRAMSCAGFEAMVFFRVEDDVFAEVFMMVGRRVVAASASSMREGVHWREKPSMPAPYSACAGVADKRRTLMRVGRAVSTAKSLIPSMVSPEN